MKRSEFRIAILLVTFNHAEYIQRAIDSVLMQDINESYEIVVADDGSSDETLQILERAARENPGVPFRFLDSSINRGITRNYERAFDACESEFIAVLEGDDYWISPSKLRAQRDFLDAHRECDLCSVNYYVYEEHRAQFTPRTAVGGGHIILGARELIADNLVGNFSTCMYRTAALRRLPPALYEIRSYDWAVNICIARSGLIGFLKEPMSVYRIHNKGAWSLLNHLDKLKTQLELIPAYDSLTGHVFHHDFMVLSERLVRVIADHQNPALPAKEVPVVESMGIPPLHSKVLDIVPPIVISIGRQVLPPALKRYVAKLIFKS